MKKDMTQSTHQQSEATIKNKRVRANILDVIIFLILGLIIFNNESMGSALKIILIALYPLLLVPVMMILGGSPGHRITGLRLKRKSDPAKYPDISHVYRHLFGIKSDTVLTEPDLEVSEEEKKVLLKRKVWINFTIAAVIYTLWVIWLGNYWFLLGLAVVYDVYISKKVNWTPWKKRTGKNHIVIEWIDALIFAVVAVTIINIFLFQNYNIPTGSMEKSLLIGDHLYVSKVAYGPRIPQTPLSIPFMNSTIPGTDRKSYVEWIKLPYKRLKGFGKIEHDDPVVFNFPEGDTVTREKELQALSYYYIVRAAAEDLRRIDKFANQPLKSDEEYYALGRKEVRRKYDLVVRPVDRRDNYIKRCIAIPGDSLEIIDGVAYVNGQRQKEIPGLQYEFAVAIEGRPLNEKKLLEMGISPEDVQYNSNYTVMQVTLTDELAEKMQKNRLVKGIDILVRKKDYYDNKMFPHDDRFQWNLDNYGPIYIPAKGATIDINLDNLPLYRRIIGYYEANDLKVVDSTIYVNGVKASQYTFKMDYYWMMGDNRHRSLDSRYWGFVPEDHVVGKPRLIWLSLDRDKSFPANIRLKRMFKGIS